MNKMTYRQFVERREKHDRLGCYLITCSECPFETEKKRCGQTTRWAAELLTEARARARMEVSEKLALI